ncbi:hypothetical protein [Sedimentibacter sp.]|uniref:hypothetical protein n=1 Tax=Sedimentibacter sp. TaxID=1960295 RepID=UPI00289F6A72|nr:hypothetical protein [Sedimentibacter sp.]
MNKKIIAINRRPKSSDLVPVAYTASAITIILLLIAVVISYNFNKQTMEAQKEILRRAEIILKEGNKETLLNMETIKGSGEEIFEAILDTSTTDATLHSYVGVQLKNILKENNIEINEINGAVIIGADGYAVAYSREEIINDKNIFITYMEDGKYLGSRDNGGRGPYESIVVNDTFSNRRCKWITKIEVK